MDKESFKEARKRLDAAGIPYVAMREICLENERDEAEAKALLQGLSKDKAKEARRKEMAELKKAVEPLMEYMKKRKSQTYGLDGATVIATYEGVTLKVDKMGFPI